MGLLANLAFGTTIHEASSLALAPLHAATSGLWIGTERSSHYVGNYKKPNVLPPVLAIFEAYQRRDIAKEEFELLLRWHGIQFNMRSVQPTWKASDLTWESFQQALYNKPDFRSIMTLASRGFFGSPNTVPADAERINSLLRFTKTLPDDWKEAVESLNFTLSPAELKNLFLRGVFSQDDYFRRLRAIGVVSNEERSAHKAMTFDLPSGQEMAVMARRFAFAGDDVIEALQLDAHLDDEYLFWAKRAGLGTVDAKDNDTGESKSYDFAKGLWRIHWNTIAPSLAYEFYQRYRPGRDHFGERPEFAGIEFPLNSPDPKKLTLDLALRDAGYSPAWRDMLAGISFRVLGFRQATNIQYQGLAPGDAIDNGLEWLTNRLQDNGYQEDAAKIYSQAIIKQNAQRKASTQIGLTRQLIEDSWKIGIIDNTTAINYLQSIGLSPPEANAAVNGWELGRVHDLAKRLVAAARKNYLLGDYNDIEAQGELVASGIIAERAAQYIQLWSVEQRQYRLERSPAILTKWLKIGTIDESEFRSRLSQIGWAQPDIERILAYALYEASKGVKPKDQTPKGKGGRKGKGAYTDLSRAEVRGMFMRGIINRDETIQLLRGQGFDEQDIGRILTLWSKESVPTGVT